MAPEMEPQDVPLPGEQVVADIQAGHSFEMAPDDTIGDERGKFCRRIPAVLDFVQRRGSDLQPLLVLFVPVRHAGIQVPAVVIEPGSVGDVPDSGEILALDFPEAHGDVSHLHAGVVDVVLNFDIPSKVSQQTAEGVTERGIPQVSDVRRLVRVDCRVFDDRLVAGGWRHPVRLGEPGRQVMRPIEKKIEVPVRGRLDAGDAVDGAEGAGHFLGDDTRGLAQAAGELECQGDGEVPEGAARGNVDRHAGQDRVIGRDVVQARDGLGHAAANELLDGKDHAGVESGSETSMIRCPDEFDSRRPSSRARS